MNLIKKLICLCRGHEWKADMDHKYMKTPPRSILEDREEIYKYLHIVALKCARYGKTKEVRI